VTFDLEKARALCDQATFKATGNPIDETLKLLVDQAETLPAALDRIAELEAALIEERARGLFNGTWCSDLPDDCGFDAEMGAARTEARKQLHSEGKI
jgi:hypothetical protein